MRELAFGMVDLKLHREYNPATHPDVMAYARDIYATFLPAPLPPRLSGTIGRASRTYSQVLSPTVQATTATNGLKS